MDFLKPHKFDTIIFESGDSGHRSVYASHLMSYIDDHPELHNKFLFMLHKGMKPYLKDVPFSSNYSVEFIDIKKVYNNHLSQSFENWRHIKKALDATSEIKGIIFMEIDTYFLLIGSPAFKRFKIEVRGILLQPHVHFQHLHLGIGFAIRYVWKNLFLLRYGLLRNRRIKKVFLLNDRQAVKNLNRKMRNVFYSLPDPIERYDIRSSTSEQESILANYNITKGKKNLLVFGSIDSRKNLDTIIDALLHLPEDIRQKIHLVISGKIGPDASEKYMRSIKRSQDQISIGYNDDYVLAEEREILFKNCDLVLMPYINFYSASSVVGHAISHQKSILATKIGLLGKIVRENGLGLTVDPLNPIEIRDAVITMLFNTNMHYDSEKLLSAYNVQVFCETLLTD